MDTRQSINGIKNEGFSLLLGSQPLLSREAASIARDALELTKHWWEESRPRRRGSPKPAPQETNLDFPELLHRWLKARNLENLVEQEADQQGCSVYRLVSNSLTKEQEGWDIAFHGTRWYALWLILASGVMLESDDLEAGHDFWEPGVYCTPVFKTARWYGRPHILFGDGAYHRAILELRVDPKRRKRERQRGGVQWVFPAEAVVIRAVWFQVNNPPEVDEQRFVNWDPMLEAIPPGRKRLRIITNPRYGEPNEHEDEDGEAEHQDAFDPRFSKHNPEAFVPLRGSILGNPDVSISTESAEKAFFQWEATVEALIADKAENKSAKDEEIKEVGVSTAKHKPSIPSPSRSDSAWAAPTSKASIRPQGPSEIVSAAPTPKHIIGPGLATPKTASKASSSSAASGRPPAFALLGHHASNGSSVTWQSEPPFAKAGQVAGKAAATSHSTSVIISSSLGTSVEATSVPSWSHFFKETVETRGATVAKASSAGAVQPVALGAPPSVPQTPSRLQYGFEANHTDASASKSPAASQPTVLGNNGNDSKRPLKVDTGCFEELFCKEIEAKKAEIEAKKRRLAQEESDKNQRLEQDFAQFLAAVS